MKEKITTHFTIAEFEHSDTATIHEIENKIPKDLYQNILYGCEKILEPAREKLGKPIRITSGYRCPQLNKLVGGAANSYHMKGMAADLHVECFEHAAELFQKFRANQFVDLCLFEHARNGTCWLHVQWSPHRQPRKIFNFNYNAK